MNNRIGRRHFIAGAGALIAFPSIVRNSVFGNEAGFVGSDWSTHLASAPIQLLPDGAVCGVFITSDGRLSAAKVSAEGVVQSTFLLTDQHPSGLVSLALEIRGVQLVGGVTYVEQESAPVEVGEYVSLSPVLDNQPIAQLSGQSYSPLITRVRPWLVLSGTSDGVIVLAEDLPDGFIVHSSISDLTLEVWIAPLALSEMHAVQIDVTTGTIIGTSRPLTGATGETGKVSVLDDRVLNSTYGEVAIWGRQMNSAVELDRAFVSISQAVIRSTSGEPTVIGLSTPDLTSNELATASVVSLDRIEGRFVQPVVGRPELAVIGNPGEPFNIVAAGDLVRGDN